jgi:hypothetical protein
VSVEIFTGPVQLKLHLRYEISISQLCRHKTHYRVTFLPVPSRDCDESEVHDTMLSSDVNHTSTFMFDFERHFDQLAFHSWMKRNWTCAFWFSTVYVLVIGAGSRYMTNRSPYELRLPLVAWNTMLAVFSVAGTVRMTSELVDILRRPGGGWTESICNPSFYVESPAAFWAAAFTLSKVSFRL